MKNKKKKIILSSIILGALVLTLGITYAIFTYNAQSANQQLILGDIWMSYNETSTNIQLKDAMPQELLADDFIAKKGYLNPIMKEQTVEYENELTACVSLFQVGWAFDEGSDVVSYCQGTGTLYGMTFQENLDDWMINDNFAFDYMTTNNIIIQDGESYIVNTDMVNQKVGEINELMACVGLFTSGVGYFDEGTTAESFCKGIGTYDGLTYSEHGDNQTEFYQAADELLQSKKLVIEHKFLLDVDLPYFEFHVNGKNTYTEQDVKYEIVLNNSEYNGDDKAERTERIEDKFLKFSLVEINDLGVELVFHNRSYEDLTDKSVFTNTISNTDGTINRTYRLYMWIGDEVVIGGGEATYDYDMATWNKIYASVRVDVKGDFIDKEITNNYVPATDSASFKRLVNNQFQDTTYVDTDGTVYLSGTNDEVNYNYVWYSGKLWRITAIYPDGTMKMITDGLITTIAYGSNNKFYTDENATSYIYQWLNQEFLPTLYNYENIIVEDAVWNASPSDGTISTKLPVSGQEEVLVNASVGLLNSYEFYKSYQNSLFSNSYLNIGYSWWLLNPYSASSSLVWYVDDNSYGNKSGPPNSYGARPSIYLKSGVQLIGGNGTESNPYRIKGDQEQAEANVTLRPCQDKCVNFLINF